MKKVASLVAAALITCSLGACGNRNTAYRNGNVNQPVRNAAQDMRNAGQNIRNVGQNVRNDVTNRNTANAPGVGTTAYKDGIYLGEGNRDSRGTQAAIVTIRGGKITDVVFKTLDAQGRDVAHYNVPAGTTNGNANTTVGGNAADATKGATGNTGSTMGGTGTVGGTMGNNNTNRFTGGAVGGPTGGTMGGTNIGISGRNTNGTTQWGTNTGTNTGVGTNVGTNNGTTGTNLTTLDIAKRDLANAIVSNQTANVNIKNSHPATVDNWKLAVSRALESAKR